MSYHTGIGKRVVEQLTGRTGRCYDAYWGRWPLLLIRWDATAYRESQWEWRCPIGIAIHRRACCPVVNFPLTPSETSQRRNAETE